MLTAGVEAFVMTHLKEPDPRSLLQPQNEPSSKLHEWTVSFDVTSQPENNHNQL